MKTILITSFTQIILGYFLNVLNFLAMENSSIIPMKINTLGSFFKVLFVLEIVIVILWFIMKYIVGNTFSMGLSIAMIIIWTKYYREYDWWKLLFLIIGWLIITNVVVIIFSFIKDEKNLDKRHDKYRERILREREELRRQREMRNKQ